MRLMGEMEETAAHTASRKVGLKIEAPSNLAFKVRLIARNTLAATAVLA